MSLIVIVSVCVVVLGLATIFLLFRHVNILYSIPLIVLMGVYSIYAFTTTLSLQKSLNDEITQNKLLTAELEKQKEEPVLSTKEEVRYRLEPMIVPLKLYFKDIPLSDISTHTDAMSSEIFGEDVSLEVKQEVLSYVLALLG